MTTSITESVTEPQPAKRSTSRASKAAARAAADKPAPKPATTKGEAIAVNVKDEPEITERAKREIVLSALVRAGAELAESWNDDRVTKTEAAEILGHRLSYCGRVEWDPRLPKTEIASRSTKK